MVRKICLDIDILVGNKVIQVVDLEWFFLSILKSYKGISSFIKKNCVNYKSKDIENMIDTDKNDEERKNILYADNIIAAIKEDNYKLSWFIWFAKKASEEEKIKLVNYLKQEKNEVVKKIILEIIIKGKFPITFEYLKDLYNTTSEYLTPSILDIMTILDDDRIKQFGYSVIENDNLRNFGLKMICKFYDKSDQDLLLSYVPKVQVTYDDKYGWHFLIGLY